IKSGEHLSMALPLPGSELPSARTCTLPKNMAVEQSDISSIATVRHLTIKGRFILILQQHKRPTSVNQSGARSRGNAEPRRLNRECCRSVVRRLPLPYPFRT